MAKVVRDASAAAKLKGTKVASNIVFVIGAACGSADRLASRPHAGLAAFTHHESRSLPVAVSTSAAVVRGSSRPSSV